MGGAMDRRDFVRVAASTTVVLGLGASLSACAAEAAAVVFNPAVDSWLSDLAGAIAAAELTNFLNNGVKKVPELWRDWFDGVIDAADKYSLIWGDCYGHSIPPVILAQVTKAEEPKNYGGDPMVDGLLACVNNGRDAIYFEPWAWQALSMYVHSMTNGLSGQNLANAQRVCVTGLIPCGTRPDEGRSPENVVAWMTYETRSGPVEIGKLLGSDGKYIATVKATGIWDADQQPLVQQFSLPAQSAGPQ
jgi:hypothetical protein